MIPEHESTVALVLPWVVKNNIELAIKGGGHSTAGASSTDTGLVIDLALLAHTVVNPRAETLRVGGGATWFQVDAALARHGLSTVGGTVSDTGVGGLTLGGGYGWLSGKYGLVIDNLISVKVVLASGEIITASDKENSDLFWGLRGAGQNFGVAVEFVFQAYDQDKVWAGPLIFPPPALPQVVEVINQLVPTLSGIGSAGIGFARPEAAGRQAVVLVPIFFDGTEEEGKDAFKALLDLAPVANMVKYVDYAVANQQMNIPAGHRASMKGVAFKMPVRPEFAQEVFENYVKMTEDIPDASDSVLLFEIFNPGQVCKLATNKDMAFANRGHHFNGLVCPLWNDASNDEACRQWSRDMESIFAKELKAAKTAGETDADKDAVMRYGNYEHYEQRGRDIFGINYDRLAALKKRYDPTNIFNKLFTVTPAA